MKRLAASSFLILALLGCSKPSTEDCRKAVLNLQRIRGLDTDAHAPDPEAAVRKCRSTANPTTVRCLIDAKTADDVARCEPAK
jgi:hypothetical protein